MTQKFGNTNMIGYKYYFGELINLFNRQEQKLEREKQEATSRIWVGWNEGPYKPPNIKYLDTLGKIKHL